MTATSTNDERIPIQHESALGIVMSAICALRYAHDIVVSAIEGKPQSFDCLENYLSEVGFLQNYFELDAEMVADFLEAVHHSGVCWAAAKMSADIELGTK